MQEKNKCITVSESICRKDEGQFDVIGFPGNELSVVKLYKHIEANVMTPSSYGN